MSKFSTWLASLTADPTPDPAADYLVTYDASATTSKKLLISVLLALATGSGIPSNGWIAAGETWTYVSADGPTGVFSVPADVTGKYQPGMRVKYTQTTVKYGIITAVGAFAAGVTPITIYGGTDYVTANAAITLPFYSPVKCPFGFPMSPAKWTVTLTDTTTRTQATPTAGTWYNPGALSISIPIGVWQVTYQAALFYMDTVAADWAMYSTLSTANNSESDPDFTALVYAVASKQQIGTVNRTKLLTLAAKTSYFMNAKSLGAGLDSINFDNPDSKLIITAVCALL